MHSVQCTGGGDRAPSAGMHMQTRGTLAPPPLLPSGHPIPTAATPPRLLPRSFHPRLLFFPPRVFFYFINLPGLLPLVAACCPRQVLREHHHLPDKRLAARCRQGEDTGQRRLFPPSVLPAPLPHAAPRAVPLSEPSPRLGDATVARDTIPGAGLSGVRAHGGHRTRHHQCPLNSSRADFVEAVVPGGTVTMPSLTPHGGSSSRPSQLLLSHQCSLPVGFHRPAAAPSFSSGTTVGSVPQLNRGIYSRQPNPPSSGCAGLGELISTTLR